MQKIKEFESWLMNGHGKRKDLSASSSYKYARAIQTISDDMLSLGVIDRNLYFITDTHELKKAVTRITENQQFIKKNEIGHNMYSVALNHYIDFVSDQH